MNPDIVRSLICPVDRTPLAEAEPNLVAKLNAAITAGRLVNQGGKSVSRPIEGGFVRADRQICYPIVDQIPLLLADEGIALAQLGL